VVGNSVVGVRVGRGDGDEEGVRVGSEVLHTLHVDWQDCLTSFPKEFDKSQYELRAAHDKSGESLPVSQVGDSVGLAEGLLVGTLVGFVVGARVGDSDGEAVGASVGLLEGLLVGASVGFVVGVGVGDTDGEAVGALVGLLEGLLVGASVGFVVGAGVGDTDGEAVGAGWAHCRGRGRMGGRGPRRMYCGRAGRGCCLAMAARNRALELLSRGASNTHKRSTEFSVVWHFVAVRGAACGAQSRGESRACARRSGWRLGWRRRWMCGGAYSRIRRGMSRCW
jgi:hypothetical protein